MKNNFKIFYVSAEVTPFIKEQGVADTAGALPKALKDLGHDIRMMMPNYRSVNERKYILRDVIRLKEMSVQLGDKTINANGKSAFLPDSKVQIYFLDYKPFFDRNTIYRDPKTKKEYADNAERFSFFALGCLETLKLLHWQPDIIHCNDWATALIPFFLRTKYRDDPFFKNTKVLLTVHDLSEQGIFTSDRIDALGLSADQHYAGSQIEVNGKFNFLKAGVLCADSISLVGESFAKEVKKNADIAFGLGEIIQKRKRAVTGVDVGIDALAWNPEANSHFEHHFSATSLAGKGKSKAAFLEEHGLTQNEQLLFIVVMVNTQLINEFDKFEQFLADLLKLEAQVLVMGELTTKMQRALGRLAKQSGNRFACEAAPDEAFLHRSLAAADLLLQLGSIINLPVNHFHAMRYGTVPVVSEKSEFSALINDYNQKVSIANGFLVPEKASAKQIQKIVQQAVGLFAQKSKWQKLVKNAMKQDNSWHSIAESHTKIYSHLLGRNKK